MAKHWSVMTDEELSALVDKLNKRAMKEGGTQGSLTYSYSQGLSLYVVRRRGWEKQSKSELLQILSELTGSPRARTDSYSEGIKQLDTYLAVRFPEEVQGPICESRYGELVRGTETVQTSMRLTDGVCEVEVPCQAAKDFTMGPVRVFKCPFDQKYWPIREDEILHDAIARHVSSGECAF